MGNERAANTPPEGLVIRRATVGDLARVVELLVLGAVPGPAPEGDGPEDLEPYVAAFDEIDDGDGAVLVAELDGEIIGVCQLIVFRHLQSRGGRCAEIESVHVHPDHRGKGVGGALLQEAISRACVLGCYRVQLTSNTVRADAHRFYQRLGFVPSHVGFKLPLH